MIEMWTWEEKQFTPEPPRWSCVFNGCGGVWGVEGGWRGGSVLSRTHICHQQQKGSEGVELQREMVSKVFKHFHFKLLTCEK